MELTMTQSHSPTVSTLPATDIELVLAAGGIKGFDHIGVLKALRESNVPIGKVTGVSVGSIIAAFYTNGYTPEQIREIFFEGLNGRNSLTTLLSCMKTIPDPITFAIGGMLDLIGAVRDMVARYNLKPNHNLRIVACDIMRHSPVVFEGVDYDLAHAIASSCSLPGVFRPQWHHGPAGIQLLGDGALYHYSPPEFCSGPAIFSIFRQATTLPTHFASWMDYYFSVREIYFPLAGNQRYVDPNRHLVIESGLADVAGLNFGISAAKCDEMIEDGLTTGRASLASARAEGRFAHTDVAA
jgi:hypothetical protein